MPNDCSTNLHFLKLNRLDVVQECDARVAYIELQKAVVTKNNNQH